MRTHTMGLFTVSSVVLLACTMATVSHAAEIHVPFDSPTIYGALHIAEDGDTIIVADGVWAGHNNRDLFFYGKEVLLRSAHGPHVRGWNYDGASVAAISAINFFAWPQEEVSYGAKVCALADLEYDGRAELVVGQGPDPTAASPVKVYRFDGAQLTQWFDLEAYSGLTHGTNVAAGRF